MPVRSSKRLWVSALIGLMAAGLLSLSLSSASPAGASAPLRLTFEKEAVATGVWKGTVSGDVHGDLTTVLTACTCSGQIWQVEFDWIIDAGPKSFTAHLKGTLDNGTGVAVMKGTVVEGFLLGARVREKGQLVNPATLRFEGTIRVKPAGHDRTPDEGTEHDELGAPELG